MKQKSILNTFDIELLFKEHYTFLCLVSFSILKDKDAARDVVQDFFILFWQKREDISLKFYFKAYAIRAVKNLSLIELKKASKKQSLDLIIDKQEDKIYNFVEKGNKYEKIWALLNQLPQGRKDIFISYVVYNQSYAEIAELNSISINTVKTQMKRAYSFLRAKAKKSDLVCLLLFYLSSNFL
jgi:RNA polymerase sigma factor (sigma-70 family)